MKATLILNEFGNIGLFYNTPLGITPEWAAIDVERGELYVYDPEGESRSIPMEGMTKDIYDKLIKEQKILLVRVLDDDITKPVNALWVSLMISQQI